MVDLPKKVFIGFMAASGIISLLLIAGSVFAFPAAPAIPVLDDDGGQCNPIAMCPFLRNQQALENNPQCIGALGEGVRCRLNEVCQSGVCDNFHCTEPQVPTDICGNNICEESESCTSCETDCGCSEGTSCLANYGASEGHFDTPVGVCWADGQCRDIGIACSDTSECCFGTVCVIEPESGIGMCEFDNPP